MNAIAPPDMTILPAVRDHLHRSETDLRAACALLRDNGWPKPALISGAFGPRKGLKHDQNTETPGRGPVQPCSPKWHKHWGKANG